MTRLADALSRLLAPVEAVWARRPRWVLPVVWWAAALYVLVRVTLDAGLDVVDVVFVAWLGGILSVFAYGRLAGREVLGGSIMVPRRQRRGRGRTG